MEKNPDSKFSKNDFCRFMHSGEFEVEKTLDVLKREKEFRIKYNMEKHNYYYKGFKKIHAAKCLVIIGQDRIGRPIMWIELRRVFFDKMYVHYNFF